MNRIKKLRESFGYTQQELANKLNCSKSIIGLYENETRNPSIEVLITLSEIFDCSLDYIMGIGEKKMNDRAKYLTVSTEQNNKITDIRVMFSSMYNYVEESCKPGRETSLVLTKLEEAQFWLIKGVTREKSNENT